MSDAVTSFQSAEPTSNFQYEFDFEKIVNCIQTRKQHDNSQRGLIDYPNL